jgi:hypothetical protein
MTSGRMSDQSLIGSFADRIEPFISFDRLEAYRAVEDDDFTMVTNYLLNVVLSEALYTSLAFVEITLRNSLHATLQRHFGSSTWYDIPLVLDPYETNVVRQVKNRLANVDKHASPGRVVAELGFGFWVALLSRDYDGRFWRPNRARLLKDVFPHVPSHMRQRRAIHQRYDRLRALRNRVFHHEPIWNRPTLAEDHATIYEALSWISEDVAIATRLVDRFPDVFSNERGRIEATLRQHFGSIA